MPADSSELSFRAMGSDAHVIVVGGASGLAHEARDRVADLERRWSRFLDSSEISTLNRHAGSPVAVSPETLELVERALDAWRFTAGSYDPTVLGAVLRAGYVRSFDQLGPRPPAGSSELTRGAGGIEVLGRVVRLPAGAGFDAGGIGKGLAADIVTRELMEAGARGAAVNLGGDVRVRGVSPRGGAWTVTVDHPACAEPVTQLGITDGAVASSTTLCRRWEVDGEARHHLIDPATGRPSTSDLTFVTVVARNAWAGEVLAKAVLLRGRPHHFDVLAPAGAEGLAVDEHGRVDITAGLRSYLGDGALPAHLAPGGVRAQAAS